MELHQMENTHALSVLLPIVLVVMITELVRAVSLVLLYSNSSTCVLMPVIL